MKTLIMSSSLTVYEKDQNGNEYARIIDNDNGFLDNLTTELDIDLTVTSALGTENSPHEKVGGHYNDKNPKLDFGGGLTVTEANEIKNKLDTTNYFESVIVEEHGDGTAHIDVKIKDEALKNYA